MKVHEVIKKRRQELELREVQVATAAGFTIYEYGDIEQHATEVLDAVAVKDLHRLCDVLHLNFEEVCQSILLENGIVSQEDNNSNTSHIAVRELVRKQRQAIGLSEAELADAIGFETTTIEKLESGEFKLEEWPLEYIVNLAKTLGLPWKILMFDE